MAAPDLNALILKYVNKKLLRNEFVKIMPIFEKATIDNAYNGGDIENVFVTNEASSTQAGGLTPIAEIAEMGTLTGTVAKANVPKLYGSLKFKEDDIFLEDGSTNEGRIKFIIKSQIPTMLETMKTRLNRFWLTGTHLASLTATGGAGGTITLDRVGSFKLWQKIVVRNTTPTSAVGWISAINKNTKVVTLVTAYQGATPLNCSAFTTALTSRVYNPGNINLSTHALEHQFNCINTNLLSYANGGDASFMGNTKATYPYLQAYNASGAAITRASVLENIFDIYNDFTADDDVIKGPHECLMPHKWYGEVKKALQAGVAGYIKLEGSDKTTKPSMYGWKSVEIGAPDGDTLTVVNGQGMPPNAFYFMKWPHIKVYSHNMLQVIKSPDGNMYHTNRVDNGQYEYVVDVKFLGDMYPDNLQQQAIVYGVPEL